LPGETITRPGRKKRLLCEARFTPPYFGYEVSFFFKRASLFIAAFAGQWVARKSALPLRASKVDTPEHEAGDGNQPQYFPLVTFDVPENYLQRVTNQIASGSNGRCP
jgi:hypothetical protein